MRFKSSVRWLFCFVLFFRWLITFIIFLRESLLPQRLRITALLCQHQDLNSYLLPSRPHRIAARRSRLLPPPNPTEGPPEPAAGQGAVGAEERRAHVPLPGPARTPPVLLRKTSTSQYFLPSPASCSSAASSIPPNSHLRLRVPATLL